MDPGTDVHLLALKEALHTLKDSGPDGFEGLLASVLSDVGGQPFRLASSGSQRGRDGDSAFDSGATYFEAKLYQGDVPRSTVSNKLLELSIDDKAQVDTWVLCATAPISTQHSQLYRDSLAKAGIGCLILDWPEHTLPPLAVLLASSRAGTEDFLNQHTTDASKVAGIRTHLDGIAADSQFADNATGLRRLLREPSLGLGIAKAVNQRWMIETFSDRRRARQFFNQPLAPLDPSGLASIDRPALASQLASAFAGAPDETVFIVIGDEGTGKSWLVAKAWLSHTPSPLLAVFTADELQMPMAMHDIEGTLITKLAAQTGDTTDVAKYRWKRRFKGWQANSQPPNVRLVVWIDGLNQAQDFNWPTWMGAAAKLLQTLGGRLIVTTNQRHFAQRLRNAVTSKLRRVIVSEWSEDDLGKILSSKGISPDRLSAEVVRFLRNPRILGIAAELLDAKDIEGFEELTVGRLLFEHIRRCESDGTTAVPVGDFVQALRDHADQIVARHARQQHEDLKLFPIPLNDRLRAVANSRFFSAVPGEANLYAIKDEGLPLALGLSLVGSLRKEHRNSREPAARLSHIVEPILALAETSEVIFAALEVACLDHECPAPVTTALIRYYLALQNLPEARWPAFAALVKAAPDAFVAAARDMALSDDHQPHGRMLTIALLGARSNQAASAAIKTQVVSWLGYYSLAPERRMLSQRRRDAPEKFEAERSKRQAELDARQSELSPRERSFIDTRLIRKDEGDISSLHLLALQLLAGTKLVDLSDALVNCAFSDALNAALDSPHQEFAQLVRFNTTDWGDTREAMLRSAAPLMQAGTSRVGEWALVAVLRATGHRDDAIRADEIVERLTKDRARFLGGRHVESYCDTDPCDPASAHPSNISATAARYAALDVAALRQGRGSTAEDHFFTDALPGLARFEPTAAIDAVRRFGRDATEREGLAQRQAVLSLLPNSAVLDDDTVAKLIVIAKGASGAVSESMDERNAWITGQYASFAALPHKSGNDQLAIIADMPGRSLLLSMLQCLSAADEAIVEAHLERVVQGADSDAQARVMSFVQYSASPLSARSRKHVETLLASPDKLVRSFALGISARLREKDLLRAIATSGWDAAALDRKEDYYELWYGSSALLAAAEMGIIDQSDAVNRIATGFYADAIRCLSKPASSMAAARIDAALKKAAALKTICEIPLIEQPVPSVADGGPPLRGIVDETQSSDVRAFFDRLSETPEAYEARQKRAWEAVEQFAKEVSVADAGIILDDFSWEGFEAIVSAEPALARSWMSLLTGVQAQQFRSLHFFALGLARALARADPAGAADLFKRLSKEDPLIRRVVGPSRIPAEAVAVWSAADLGEIKTVCFERLDRAASDSELAVEVLAAFSVGKSLQINAYIDEKLASGLPSEIARALIVAGFSDGNPHAADTIKRFADHKGFLGKTCDAARYAYERNEWARQWYLQMTTTHDPKEFWRNAVLLAKIVDARYALWRGDDTTATQTFRRFFPTVEGRIENCIKNWQDKRQKALFGQEVPDPIFLGGM